MPRLDIPNKNQKITMSRYETLDIFINGDCTFCHDGASVCFPNGFLNAGNHSNGDQVTHWIATVEGEVGYDALPGKDKPGCTAKLKAKHHEDREGILSPAHTITVTS
jgi:hypothetical protein